MLTKKKKKKTEPDHSASQRYSFDFLTRREARMSELSGVIWNSKTHPRFSETSDEREEIVYQNREEKEELGEGS